MVGGEVQIAAQATSELVEVGREGVGGLGLHGEVAQCTCLHRAGVHGPSGQVGGQLAEKAVLAATADDVDDVDRLFDEGFGVADGAGVRRGKRIEDAPGDADRVRSVASRLCCTPPGYGPACRRARGRPDR